MNIISVIDRAQPNLQITPILNSLSSVSIWLIINGWGGGTYSGIAKLPELRFLQHTLQHINHLIVFWVGYMLFLDHR